MSAAPPGDGAPVGPAARRRPSWGWLLPLSLGLAFAAARATGCGLGDWLDEHAAFDKLPDESLSKVDDLLLVPAASLLVVFCRVTLGLRMLGPFRPILIGLAFYQTGTWTGLLFLVAVLVVVVLARPRLRGGLLPYFGRLSTLLSLVVLLELVVLLVGAELGSERLLRAAVFPIVVLCLSVDGFARVISDHGLVPAVWRAVVTLAIAVVVAQLGTTDVVADFLFAFPEFVLVEIGAILFVSTRMNWQLLKTCLPRERGLSPG